VFCVGVRPAVALRRPTHSDTDQTQNAPVWRSSRLSSHSHTRHDKPVLSVSYLVWRCELNARQVCSASECVRRSHCAARRRSLSVWRSSRLSSHSDNRHDKPVLSVSCLAWRCELATSRHVAQCLLLKVAAGTTAVVGPTTCTRGRRTCWRRDAWRPPAAHWPPTASTSATRRRSSWRCTAPEYTACTRSTTSHRSPQPSVLLLRPR